MKEKHAIVPATRLIFWTGAVVTPFSGVTALAPAFAPIAHLIMGAFLLLVVLDIWVSRGILNQVRISAPEVCRLSVGGEKALRLMLGNRTAAGLCVHMGLPIAPEIRADPVDRWIDLAAQADRVPVDWPIHGLKQGRCQMKRCHLEIPSRFGFWMMRASRRLDIEIRVYPGLWKAHREMAAFFSGHGSGLHRQQQIGKGRDFDQLREYLPGDSYEDIHWKATAKRQQPITRVYQVERTQHIYVVIDASRLSARQADPGSASSPAGPAAPVPATVLDRFISSALVLALAAQRQGDRFGLCVFDDNIRVFLKAGTGKLHFNTCRESLLTLSPGRVSPDFAEVFTHIGTHVRRRALMIFLTSLDDPVLAESFAEHAGIVSRRHLTMVQMIRPKPARPLFSEPAVKGVDELYQLLGGHFLWTNLRQTARILQRRGVQMALADNADFCPALLSGYLSVKQRQIL